MGLAANMLERTLVYQLWQAPFAAQKFAPVLEHNDWIRLRRALDVACGPGTNTVHFAGVASGSTTTNATSVTPAACASAIFSWLTFAISPLLRKTGLTSSWSTVSSTT
jgi:hypothetical protein